MSNKTRTDVLNLLVRKYDYKTYLEIGTQRRAQNFDQVKIMDIRKTCVDPDPEAGADFVCTSDVFFRENFDMRFDLIFIDGLHSADQVMKDFANSMKMINIGGAIVVHDTLPADESLTHFPRDKKGPWNGSTYKGIARILSNCKYTVDIDHGVTVFIDPKRSSIEYETWDYTWEEFIKARKKVMNVISWDDFAAL